jgi:hypothetical protein
MSQTITLTRLDAEADRIIERFARETGLHGEDTPAGRVFAIEVPAQHDIHVTRMLDAIDPHWPEHVGFADPV